MLTGEYQYFLDKKNRCFIPVVFRRGVRKLFLVRGLERCLFIYSPEDFKKMLRKMATLPVTKSEARAFSRIFLSGAVECKLDTQGRILIPKHLLEWAEVKKKVIIIGLFNRLELWDKDKWAVYKQESLKNYTQLADSLGL